MKFIRQSVEIRSKEFTNEYVLELIEDAARTCYKSEANKKPGSAERLVKNLISRGHEAMLEHGPSLSMRFITDRGITHEIVRHRLFSFAHESTRYVKYGQAGEDMEFILPEEKGYITQPDKLLARSWHRIVESDSETADYFALPSIEQEVVSAFTGAEAHYRALLELGCQPQAARDVLPTDVKTEIVVTGNIREWRHFFTLRCDKAAHPRMQLLANTALELAFNRCPLVFADIVNQ